MRRHVDPSALRRGVAHLRRADPVLARVIDAVGPCRLKRHPARSHFTVLLESILHQQITGKAASAIRARLQRLIGRVDVRPQDILCRSEADLRGIGLSRQKLRYLQDLSRRVHDGLELQRMARLHDVAVIDALTQIMGVGRWTAEMFLIFRLGRLDVLPVQDYGIRKAMQQAYRRHALPKPEWMRRIGEPWRPYRSVASWYLWRSLDGAAVRRRRATRKA